MLRVRAYVNGKIYGSFKPIKVHDAVVVSGNRIIYAGSSDDAIKIVRRYGGEVVDLNGKIMMPGFVDAHAHLYSLGLALNSLDLKGVRSIEELKARLKEFAQRHRGYWVYGRGWDQELFREKRYPTRWDIDEVVPDKPVILVRVCGHIAVLNTMALKELGLENIDSPFIEKKNNVPTGIVKENILMSVVRKKITSSASELAKIMIDALNYAARNGVTTIGFMSCDKNSFRALQIINKTLGRLPVRVFLYLDRELMDSLEELGVTIGLGDRFLRINGVKVFVDGSLGGRTAYLSEPYTDDPRSKGALLISGEELEVIAKRASSNGLQLAIHAIGDAALDTVLGVYEKLGVEVVRHLRHRIEHASVTRPDQLEKLRVIKPIIVIQPRFVMTDFWIVERLGEKRLSWIYPFASMISKGIDVAISTDAPVEPLNPWETVYAAVTRGALEGVELARYTPNEKLEILEVLHAYTLGSARALHMEEHIGSLEPGKYADMIIIDRDPLETSPEELRNTRVLATIVDGIEVYSSLHELA